MLRGSLATMVQSLGVQASLGEQREEGQALPRPSEDRRHQSGLGLQTSEEPYVFKYLGRKWGITTCYCCFRDPPVTHLEDPRANRYGGSTVTHSPLAGGAVWEDCRTLRGRIPQEKPGGGSQALRLHSGSHFAFLLCFLSADVP